MPSSRPSSRASLRSPSPTTATSPDDPVHIRAQMSSIKHELRIKQAQFNQLESALLRGPRPLPPSPTSPEFLSPSSSVRRRSSADYLSPDSSFIPIPSRAKQEIKEGVPLELSQANGSSTANRSSSPTRTLSRIPVSSVGHARALAEDGVDGNPSDLPSSSSGTLQSPPSPGATSNHHRRSMGPGGTTKVLADLQAGVINARSALENTKAQLRLSQRAVAQLTRQTEDLKEGRERLRLENEGLNNVVARKERLLQEVLERARKAEAEATALKAQLKTETTNSKRTIKEMETTLTEATTISQKSEREYITLKESIKSMTHGWKADLEAIRQEMKAKEEGWKKEAEDIGIKYRGLLKLVQATNTERARVDTIKNEAATIASNFEQSFREELDSLSKAISQSDIDTQQATRQTAAAMDELARMRRLMQAIRDPSSTDD